MAVARNADGRMEVFARGTDRALLHIWQVGPNTGWTNEWRSLGGSIQGVPAVGRNGDGRLEVFAVGDDFSVYHIFQTAPNGAWSEWFPLGGEATRVPVVAQNADGRLEVFVIWTDGRLRHKYQNWPTAYWSDWEWLDCPPYLPLRREDEWANPFAETDVLTFPLFDVVGNANGRLEAFAIAPDGALWHTLARAPNVRGSYPGWDMWDSLGRPADGALGKAVVAARNADGRLEVFATRATQDSPLYHIWQTAPGGTWSGWHSLGGTLTSSPAVSRTADERLEVFGCGLDHRVWHKWQGGPVEGWSDWEALGVGNVQVDPGSGAGTDGAPTVGQNADGRLQVFIARGAGAVWQIWQDAMGWSDWHNLATWTVHRRGGLGRGLIAPS
jgi:hypothetical protein